jgi:glycosyltransferase involved in cell wall biosynthesis
MQSQGIPYLKGLLDKGIKCFLLSFEKKIKGAAEFKEELENSGIKWYYLKYHKRPSFPATSFDVVAGILVGLCTVLSKDIDIIHSRGTVSAVIGYIIARFTSKKFIFDVRGLMAEEYADGGIWRRNSFLYKLTLYIEKKLLRHADKIVVLNENIKDFLINSDYISNDGKKKDITVIPCCVDIERFNAKGGLTEALRERYKIAGKFVFLYIGSLGTWYLLGEMIDFFVAAKALISNAHFLVLTHVDKNMVISAWDKRGLSFDDITIDRAKFQNMPYYIKLADAGLFFIKPCFSKRFSCPTKFAEYLACGIPVVINYGIGDTEDIVKHNRIGVVVKEFSNIEYKKAVLSLKGLIENDMEFGNRCREVSEKYFSLIKGIERYESVYRGK